MGSNRTSRKRERSRHRPAGHASTVSRTSRSMTSQSSSESRRRSRRSLKRRRSSYRSYSHKTSHKISKGKESPSRTRRRRRNRSDSTIRDHGRPLRRCRRSAQTMTPPLPTLRVPPPVQQVTESMQVSTAREAGSSAGIQWVPGTNAFLNAVPEFDPSDDTQSIETWIYKVTECSMIYGWNDNQICFYALPKLTGLAKRWYQGLPSLMFTWEQWVEKLKLAFPSNENYGDLLTKMLKIRCRFGQSLDNYFYDKTAMLNKCGIVGTKAVGCLIHGIEDKFIRIGASAGRYEQPEQLFSYLRQITMNQSAEQLQVMLKSRSLVSKPSRVDETHTSDNNKSVRCFNCGDVGHISLNCPKPVKKCSFCNLLGHLAKDCRRRSEAIMPVNSDV